MYGIERLERTVSRWNVTVPEISVFECGFFVFILHMRIGKLKVHAVNEYTIVEFKDVIFQCQKLPDTPFDIAFMLGELCHT